MGFREIIFIFVFKTDYKKGHLADNDFCRCYGDFFESVILELT